MRDVAALPKVAANGGKVPIFVATCDDANDAFAAPKGFIFSTIAAAFEHADHRRFLIPHEPLHLMEYAFEDKSVSTVTGFEWPYEACAVAVEDLAAPDVRRWSGRFAASPLFPKGVLGPDRPASFRFTSGPR